MLLRLTLLTLTFSVLVIIGAAEAGEAAGVVRLTVPSAARGSDLDAIVWYPSKGGGQETLLGDSQFFAGTSSWQDAAVADGKFPIVLLSHGAGLAGNPESLSWIAAPLAAKGFVVAAPRHPGNSGKDRSALETMKLWLRPNDISQTLDQLQQVPLLKVHLDLERVGVLGLSMGGGTALALAGARFDPGLLETYCDIDTLNASLCGWLRMSGVDLHHVDLNEADKDNENKRIRFAMAIDPGPVDVFDVAAFPRISIPVELINLGKAGSIPRTLDASIAAETIPHATYLTIGDADHFSMFGECKPGASELAKAQDIDEPICMDGDGRTRSSIHRQLIELTAASFSEKLK
jgi:predicted dienelactone hydrolase